MLNTLVRPNHMSTVSTDPAGSHGQVTRFGEQAWSLVDRWASAWNDHDLDAILDCYRDDVELRSPFVRRFDDGEAGVLRGKEAVRDYFASALERFPALRFEVGDVVIEPGQVTVSYLGMSNLLTIETMYVDVDGRAWRIDVEYRSKGA